VADLLRQLEALEEAARSATGAASDERGLEELRVRFLGKKGELSAALRGMGSLPAGERPRVGEVANRVRDRVEELLAAARLRLEDSRLEAELRGPAIDVTLAGRRLLPRGHRHPLTIAGADIAAIFARLGYEVASGPEIELDWYNFEAINIPDHHPARDMQDTFYLDRGGLLLRTHTSSAQIHYMLDNEHPPDVRIICPGKVFRRDSDVTHTPMFQQIEGLVVGRGITLGHLKGTIEAFLHALFGAQFPVRFRPSYFPYTEPSVEADLGCVVCGGSGQLPAGPCRVCKQTGWLEILGSGMVNPAVFEAVNARIGRVVYDPEEVTGFAFGLGIERVAMVRHGIDDIRLFYENDLRFLEQFAG